MKFVTLFVMLLGMSGTYPASRAVSASGVELQADSICPPEHPSARRVAFAFLTSRAYESDRAVLGLVPGDTARAALLCDSTDAAACSALNASAAAGEMWGYPWVHSYDRVGAYYIAGDGVADDADELPRSAIGVYDSNLNLLMVLGA